MTPARSYMAARAISPRIAHEFGVKLDGDHLLFPNGKRRRILGESGPQQQPWRSCEHLNLLLPRRGHAVAR